MTNRYHSICAAGLLLLPAAAGVSMARTDGPELPVDSTRQLVPTSAFDRLPAAAFNGANHSPIWQSGSDLRGTFVTPAGALVDSAGFSVLASASVGSVKVAWGGVFLVAPGANDVPRLRPGVCFVRPAPSADCPQPLAVTKVVITS